MGTLLLLATAPIAIALLIALGVRATVLRESPRLSVPVVWLTAFACGVPVLVMVSLRLAGFIFPGPWFLDLHLRALTPLLLGAAAVMMLSIAPSTSRRGAVAQISRRSVMTFVTPAWIITVIAVAAIIVALTVAAGRASRPNAMGEYVIYQISVGTTGTEMGTEIYGWHYSRTALAGIVALLILTALAWLLIPRPAWSDDQQHDTAVRRLRAANIGRVATGALLIHLSVVLTSLEATASLIGTVSTADLGTVSAGTPFAALGPTLQWSAAVAFTAGMMLWIVATLTAFPLPTRRRVVATSRAS